MLLSLLVCKTAPCLRSLRLCLSGRLEKHRSSRVLRCTAVFHSTNPRVLHDGDGDGEGDGSRNCYGDGDGGKVAQTVKQ